MMATTGHAEDTGVNLADIGFRLGQEFGSRVVFYLIENRQGEQPQSLSAAVFAEGEVEQRRKLARMLTHAAPGSRAYVLSNWTAFGFKAGGMTASDYAYEESLGISKMMIIDRNACSYDLDALIGDIQFALDDPGMVNCIPLRSTTNTLTPIGQASQILEEGHASMLRGLWLIGGSAAEVIGTGWGNIQMYSCGQVLRKLTSPATLKAPLTSGQKHSERVPFFSRIRQCLTGLIVLGRTQLASRKISGV